MFFVCCCISYRYVGLPFQESVFTSLPRKCQHLSVSTFLEGKSVITAYLQKVCVDPKRDVRYLCKYFGCHNFCTKLKNGNSLCFGKLFQCCFTTISNQMFKICFFIRVSSSKNLFKLMRKWYTSALVQFFFNIIPACKFTLKNKQDYQHDTCLFYTFNKLLMTNTGVSVFPT